MEYFRNPIASAVLLFYWLFVVIVDGVKLRSLVLMHQQTTDPVQFGLFVVISVLSLLIFALECTVRPKSQYIVLEDISVSRKRDKVFDGHI